MKRPPSVALHLYLSAEMSALTVEQNVQIQTWLKTEENVWRNMLEPKFFSALQWKYGSFIFKCLIQIEQMLFAVSTAIAH